MNKKKSVSLLRVLYLLWLFFGIFSIMLVPSLIIVEGNTTATAHNIQEQELLFRLGIVGRLITQLIFIGVGLLFYKLFKGVSKMTSALMLGFILVSLPMALFNEVFSLEILSVIEDHDQLSLLLTMYDHGMLLVAVFWGLWLFPLGALCLRSGYFPKWIGYMVLIGGIGYFMGSLTGILFPGLKVVIQIFEIMTMGEVIFLLWLLVKGVNFSEDRPGNSQQYSNT